MIEIYYIVLYEPLFNALMYLRHVIPGNDLGLAIIILTLFIKLILFYPNYSAIKSQASLQETQPKLEELKRKYKDNKEQLGKELMNFYKVNKVNPLSSCLPMLVQLPILIALYQVFLNGLKTDAATGVLVIDQLNHLYGYLRSIYESTKISPLFLGFVDLAKNKNYVLALLAGGLQYWQSIMLTRRKPPKVKGAEDEGKAASINKQMMYFMPVITVIFGIQFPAGLTLYWAVSTLFQILQQWYFFRKTSKPIPKPEI